MPKPIKKKISKKSAPTEADLKEKLTSFRDTLKERQKTLLKYVLFIIAAVALAGGLLIYSYTSSKKAKTFQYEAYKVYHGIGETQFTSKEERYQKALELFKKSYDTKKSPRSLLYIAACYYELERYDDALKALQDFVKRFSEEELLIPLAYQKMASVYVKKGNTEEAIKTLEILYNLKNDIYKDYALFEIARLLEQTGKTDEARNKYEELTVKFPASPFVEEAKSKLSAKKEG